VRIVVPYVAPAHATTIGTVHLYAPDADWVEIDRGDDEAYWRLLADLWSASEDFMLVEHDMELNGGEVEAFEECPNSWCVAPYEGKQPIWTGRRNQQAPRGPVVFRCALGCTRFRSSLLLELPDAVTHMRLKHWQRLDSQLASYLFQHGKKACEHEPYVTHLHDYDAERIAGR
jgi:hypothetical protein